MTAEADRRLRGLPSVDDALKAEPALLAVARFGRPAAVTAVRQTLDAARAALRAGKAEPSQPDAIASAALAKLAVDARSNLRPVFNLTGTVLHTNLGRALIAEAAIEAAVAAMRSAVALEFDLATGKRGERDDHLRGLLCELSGGDDATVVNNNAAAVLLVLNTLAKGREALVSRGELIEIGGAFRMPDIMACAGAKLKEIGTTNRTHLKDYVEAIGPRTGLVLKVHTSNYRIEGFTKEVAARELALATRQHNVPLVNDLGSGTLLDLSRWGAGARADSRRSHRRRRRPCDVFRRQAFGRAAGRIHRRSQSIDCKDQPQSHEARLAGRQDAACRAGSDLTSLSRSGPACRAIADHPVLGTAGIGDQIGGATAVADCRGEAR
jgi:L-seryl-tRNA(Ser) seleniumtransferase